MGNDPEYARARLQALKDEILSLSLGSGDDRKPVELDQQSVGRLSRQDSLQVQAMAKAAEARRAMELRRIEAALGRIDDGEYGWCVECGDAIAAKRLDTDPAAPRCSTCA
ncbi:TraR/DksA family transcriptional regulator [Hyphobacterium sp.]|uniref:TraR/DksA family transcriptional regulator n=1 Tax=Hyphobacterium sp. TaxID=2004662 RepID=UPI003B518B37